MLLNLKKISIDYGQKLGLLITLIYASIYFLYPLNETIPYSDLNYMQDILANNESNKNFVNSYQPILFNNFYIGCIIRIIAIGFAISCILKIKKIKNGLISFKESFSAFFICIATAYFIVNIFLYILFNIVDPEYAIMINNDKIMTYSIELFNNPSTPKAISELVNNNIESLKLNGSFSFNTIFKGYMTKLLGNAFFAIFVGLILKRS